MTCESNYCKLKHRATSFKQSKTTLQVFVTPDRSVEQEELDAEPNKKAEKEPDKRNFIKEGKVCKLRTVLLCWYDSVYVISVLLISNIAYFISIQD